MDRLKSIILSIYTFCIINSMLVDRQKRKSSPFLSLTVVKLRVSNVWNIFGGIHIEIIQRLKEYKSY